MIIMRTGGIDVDGVLKAGSGNLMPEDSLRSGRATNIAHANKQNTSFGIFSPVHNNQQYLLVSLFPYPNIIL